MVPVGEIALMGDPFADRALSHAHARSILNAFWEPGHKHALKMWPDKSRVLHLNENLRSGEDQWYSALLDACRVGRLGEDDYNFLHGFPTSKKTRIHFWWHKRKEQWEHPAWCAEGNLYEPYKLNREESTPNLTSLAIQTPALQAE